MSNASGSSSSLVGGIFSTLYSGLYNVAFGTLKTIAMTISMQFFVLPQLFKRLFGGKGESGFGCQSLASQVAKDWDGKGKVVVITGPYSGIGLETAKVLASRGCEVILAGRGKERGEKVAKEHILKYHPEAKVRVLHLDISSLESVRDFSKAFLALGLPLHILINNAGIMACPFKLSKDGYEMQFATNHLGHFLLTNLLLEHMKQSCPVGGATEGRIVNVSSLAHHASYAEGILPKDKLHHKNAYIAWKAYGQSKLANVLFAGELDKKLKEENANIISVSLHPGVIKTNLGRHIEFSNFFHNYMVFLMQPIAKSIPSGAATSVYCAVGKDIKGGEYYSDDVNIGRKGAQAKDPNLSKYLWDISSKYCSVQV